ncbi:hypothetical protein TSUD_35930 [Trifolium subterraneum]|uniref:ABC transmembrane type-1 domain-containing protein n=1 Tax=Trifolium subterraneum TaxID=3900 RepID=A0A2Z6NA05_TRISU|nr:hypothetical protein TSUD_35930 [Trifolium subterraneum]
METEKDVGGVGVDEKRNNHDNEATTSEKNGTETSTNGEKDKTKEKQETVPFHKLFTFADSTDILLMVVGTIGAIGNGLGLPLMTLLFGQMIDSFGSNQSAAMAVIIGRMASKGQTAYAKAAHMLTKQEFLKVL